MTGFQLDTSGFVLRVGATKQHPENLIAWSDLSPFVQGYVEAMARKVVDAGYRFAFSDLAPETLALILKDCERFGGSSAGVGAVFWEQRQRGVWADHGFPPLTPTLLDDGKVYLRQAQEAQS